MSTLRSRVRDCAAQFDDERGPGAARRDALWCTGALIGAAVFALGVAVVAGG